MATLNLTRYGTIALLTQHKLLQVIGAHELKISQRKSSNVDAIDIFTTNFLEKSNEPKKSSSSKLKLPKSDFIDTRIEVLKKIASHTAPNDADTDAKAAIDINKWSQSEIDHYLTIVIDCDDRNSFNNIIEQMISLKRLPSEANILRALSYLCDGSEDAMANISRLIDTCQENNLPFYAKNMEFSPFLAQYLWKLKRFDDSLHVLKSSLCTTNQSARKSAQRNYRQVIYDAVTCQDESVRDKVVAHATAVYDEQKNALLIMYVWSDCFFSTLFRNQQLANGLFASHEALRAAVSKDIGWISFSLLQRHDVDAVHRLIEQCLAFEMKSECRVCLSALFDYQYSRNDLRACSEIMDTSHRLNIPLSNIQSQKLVCLLLNKKPKLQKKVGSPKVPRFEFKF